MAILTEQIYKLVTSELKKTSIRFFSDRIKDKIYPFVMFEVTELNNEPDTGFKEDYESYKLRFNVYDNNTRPNVVVDICIELEEIFNTRVEKEFLTTDAGFHLICFHKINDSITYLNQDNYWVGKQDYNIICQRNQGEDVG